MFREMQVWDGMMGDGKMWAGSARRKGGRLLHKGNVPCEYTLSLIYPCLVLLVGPLAVNRTRKGYIGASDKQL